MCAWQKTVLQHEEHMSLSAAAEKEDINEKFVDCRWKSHVVLESVSSSNTMKSDDTYELMRARSFSDASTVSNGKHNNSYLKKLQDKLALEVKTSMRVFVKRRSQVMTGQSAERNIQQKSILTNSTVLDVDHLAQGSASCEVTTTDTLVDDKQPPPKPHLPQNYRFCLNKQRIVLDEHSSRTEKLVTGEVKDNPEKNRKDLQLVNNMQVEKKEACDIQYVNKVSTEAGVKKQKGQVTFSDATFKRSLTVHRHLDPKNQSEILRKELELLRTSKHVYRNSESMRRRLCNEERPRPKSVGDVQSLQPYINSDDIKYNEQKMIKKCEINVLRQTKSFDLSNIQSSTLTETGNHVNYEPQGNNSSLTKSMRALPPSGAHNNIFKTGHETLDSGSGSRDNSSSLGISRTSLNRDCDQSKLILVSAIDRDFQSSESSGEWKPFESNITHELSKSTCHLRRRSDTIRKFNCDSIEHKREKVRYKYQHRERKDREGSSSVGEDINSADILQNKPSSVGDNNNATDILPAKSRVACDNKESKTVSDNRSDEEKYAALSRNKILHTKSSSLDSQHKSNTLNQTGTKVVSETLKLMSSEKAADYESQVRVNNVCQNNVVVAHENSVKMDTNFNKARSNDGQCEKAEDMVTINQGRSVIKDGQMPLSSMQHSMSDPDLVFTGRELVYKVAKDKGYNHITGSAESLKVLAAAPAGKIVVRQVRIGGDVAFGVVGVQSSAACKLNGNGCLEGQGLVTIWMIADEQGRFGFNVKGGADQGMPVIVSRVAPNTPANNAEPRLNEGDQVLFINGRDVSQHSHEQVVQFIRQSREPQAKELVLIIRPNAYSGEDNSDEPDLVYVSETPTITATSGALALDLSLKLLAESLESGAALAQFEQLYRKKPGMTMNIARLEVNVPKNRYRDISPYDQTRVVLRNGPNGDYINANYVNMQIPVSGIINHYIAAQGPLPTTCQDFWQMVWEQQSTLIVMLTTKVERGRIKCHQYWPVLSETLDYGYIQITCAKEEETTSFAFREYKMTHVESQEERHISHMQYIAWPDHGVPDDPADFLEFVMKVRQKRVGLVEPVIVHCSAGIGRTGVLITMETAMCLIEASQPVYPLLIVQQMRDQRAMLIQTPSQYTFVCDAIIRCYNEGLVKPLSEYQCR